MNINGRSGTWRGTLVVLAEAVDAIVIAADRRAMMVDGTAIRDDWEKIFSPCSTLFVGLAGLQRLVVKGTDTLKFDVRRCIVEYFAARTFELSPAFWDPLGQELSQGLSMHGADLRRPPGSSDTILSLNGVHTLHGRPVPFQYILRHDGNQFNHVWGELTGGDPTIPLFLAEGTGNGPLRRIIHRAEPRDDAFRAEPLLAPWIGTQAGARGLSVDAVVASVRRMFAVSYAELGPTGAVSPDVDIGVVRTIDLEWLHRGPA